MKDHPEVFDTPHGSVMKKSKEARLALEPSVIRPDVSAHDLLHQVVMAIVDKGHASDLYDFPDVMEYFGSKKPGDPSAFGPATRDFFDAD